MQIDKLKDFVALLARESAEAILPYFGQIGLAVETKSDASPVTLADRGAELVMRALIERHFPEHGILGEEYGTVRADAEYVWVLDPVDGTKSFVAGTPQFGTLIALMHRGKPILGAINSPVSGQLLMGDNSTTTLNGKPVHVRSTTQLADAVLLTTDLSGPQRHQNGAAWSNLVGKVKKLYTWGDCHGYHLLATGGADIMADPAMNPWDIMALIPVIRGAGGTITDWQGNDPVTGHSIVASVPALHAEVIKLLNGF
ncbi:MAG: histidinol-phosphatase [Verrucomicrobiota bacterium]|nr:histidinol-phosphatase [Verrucomicrobiota bacterium]